jgi:c(7)-type cytochrome triheme protein
MKWNKRLLNVFYVTVAIAACGGGAFAGNRTDSRGATYVVDSGAGLGKRWKDTTQAAAQLTAEKLAEDGIHDPSNDAIAVLQEPQDAMAAFPVDRSGAVDWGKALGLGIITPRADIEGKSEMVVMDKDVIFKGTGDMAWVKFSHAAHTAWLGCDTCHSGLFVPQKGANKISMDNLLAGEQCGRCHGSVAFGLRVCERCHNTPQKNTPAGAQPASVDQ